jgi:hypothetical protein
MSRKLGSTLGTTKRPAKMTPGELEKSIGLSDSASREWDKLFRQLEASGIALSPAHSATLIACATLRADIKDCWAVIRANGGAYTQAGTGAAKLHPTAARLDVLRWDLVKTLALLGVQKPSPEDAENRGPSLEDILSDV